MFRLHREYYYVDWNFEYGAEDISLFNFFSASGYGNNAVEDIISEAPASNASASSEDATTGTGAAPRTSRHKKLRRRMARNVRAALSKMGVLADDDNDPEWFVTDSRGYVAVLQYIADSFLVANDKRLLLNTTVSKIEYNSNGSAGVTITTTSGKKYTSDYAICTFSAGVINKGFDNGLFSPAVPKWKSAAYNKAEMGIYTKIFLKYQKPFWDDWVYTLYADPNTYGYYPVWQNMQALGLFFPNNSNIFMVTTTNAESSRLESQDLSKTIAEAGAVLKAMYNISTAESTATDIRVPIWSKNPNFYGSYSNLVVGTEGSDYVDMEKNIGGLWFAGEATDWDWNGFVTGAYFSGDRVAKCVAKTKKTDVAVPCPQN